MSTTIPELSKVPSPLEIENEEQSSRKEPVASFKEFLQEKEEDEEEKEPLESIFSIYFQQTPLHLVEGEQEKQPLSLSSEKPDDTSLLEGLAPFITQTPFSMYAESLSTNLSPSIAPPCAELFTKMVGMMQMQYTQGITETSVVLNSNQFASSPFFGTKITITEYSTAPKSYNIQLAGTPEAILLLHTHLAELMTSFQNRPFPFKIHRIETHLLTAQKEEENQHDHQDNEKHDQR